MVFNFHRLSRRRSGGVPAKKTSEHKRHMGPYMCALNTKGTRCVQSGERHDDEHCYLNKNNNCALQPDHEVHHLEKPRKARSPSPTKKSPSSPRKRSPSSSPRKPNPWLIHVAAFRLQNPDLSYQDVLIEASKSYVKKKQ